MKRITVVTLAIVLMLILIIGVNCGSDGDNDIGITELPEGYSWYTNDEFGYKIAYPEGWTVPPEETNLQEGMDYSQYIIPANGSAYIGVSEFSEFDLDDVKAGGEEVLLNGRTAYEVELATGYPYAFDMRIRSVGLIVDGKLWIVVCQAAPSSVWDQYADIFDTAIKSFVIE